MGQGEGKTEPVSRGWADQVWEGGSSVAEVATKSYPQEPISQCWSTQTYTSEFTSPGLSRPPETASPCSHFGIATLAVGRGEGRIGLGCQLWNLFSVQESHPAG